MEESVYINSTQSDYSESLSIYIESNKLETVNKAHSLNSRFKDTFSEQNTLKPFEKKPKYAGQNNLINFHLVLDRKKYR